MRINKPTPIVPCVCVYWNERKEYYLVEKYAPSPNGGSIALKDPVLVPSDQFDESVAGVILNCFERYMKDSFDPDRVAKESDEEHRKFTKQHKKITIFLSSPDDIDIYPLERYRGGEHRSIKNSKITIDKSRALNDLSQAIHEAFSKAI